MSAPERTWLQTFVDPALEAEYQADVARITRRTHLTLWSLTAGIWVSSLLLDPGMAGSAANLKVLNTVRLCAAPLVLLAVLIGVSKPVYARFRHVGSALGILCVLGGQVAMAAFLPEPRMGVDMSATVAVVVAVFALCVWCAVLSVHPLVPVSLTLLHALAYGALGSRFPGSQPASVVIWYLGAIALGWVVLPLVDSSRRTAFLALRSLAAERARSDRLLDDLLPASIAARLKADPSRIAEHFPSATILFADIVGFTTLAAELPPADVVAALDEVFSNLDDLAQRHGLEKIKTIGDAYMLVGGVPVPSEGHVEAVATMALEMRALMASTRPLAGRQLQLRIGIHTGPVVAGVIGKRKRVYDLWGDTVNTASRMESHGVEGKIQVTAATYALLAERFELTARGPVQVKGKGEMQTWFLEGPKR